MNQHDQMLASLIFLFQSSAMQGMGKIKNPMTDTIERNMEAAKQGIDMLEMLKEKTKGNITADLERMIAAALTDLKLNYVDELKKDQAIKA
ncbi:MAG: hypothetical protein RIQ89_1999 [Bacteroidota bacterium]|jgi:hypothetical protein